MIPDGGTFDLLDLPAGLGQPVVATFQGLIDDTCSQGTVPFSVTNGIVLRIVE